MESPNARIGMLSLRMERPQLYVFFVWYETAISHEAKAWNIFPKISPHCPKNQALKIGDTANRDPCPSPEKNDFSRLGGSHLQPLSLAISKKPKASDQWKVLPWDLDMKKKKCPTQEVEERLEPLRFSYRYILDFWGIPNLEFPSSYFQVPAVELWGCIDSHCPQVEVPFLFLVRELIILQNNV